MYYHLNNKDIEVESGNVLSQGDELPNGVAVITQSHRSFHSSSKIVLSNLEQICMEYVKTQVDLVQIRRDEIELRKKEAAIREKQIADRQINITYENAYQLAEKSFPVYDENNWEWKIVAQLSINHTQMTFEEKFAYIQSKLPVDTFDIDHHYRSSISTPTEFKHRSSSQFAQELEDEQDSDDESYS